ncbi:ATP-binding protein [Variovorax sp. J31P179]|uniref:ATP-binding protein n=1 Tax=Variovorax sp. J31P179 TaxID=3053508 RepID=UPI0025760669|nr:ATP-binding protein [Variovorax sp. J31P179]MDM0084582.1 ATP-binding protein [Variovorax sp. J31P179]
MIEIIGDRTASKAPTITAQLPIEHWHAWVEDATIVDAFLDRLMRQNHRLTLMGESVRQESRSIRRKRAQTQRPLLQSERATQLA